MIWVNLLKYSLGKYLCSHSHLIRKYTTPGSDIDSFIEVIVVLSGERLNIDHDQIPEMFSPVTGKWRMRGSNIPNYILGFLLTHLDLHKIYIDDESYHSGHGQAYKFYGVQPEQGAIAIVRPDNCKCKFLRLLETH